MNQQQHAAVDRWRAVLGPDGVRTDPAELDRLAKNTTGYASRAVVAVLTPTSVDSVAEIVRVAREHKVPLYPYSTGKNWGLGSRVPPRDGCALLDLGRLNQIREVNEKHHYAIIEPGVTQGQLGEYLRERGLRLALNVTGSAPSSSVMGNLLERGTGFRNQRTEDVRGLEVVLGVGDLLRTGFWGQPDSHRQVHHYRHGTGPYLDGLFTQSNLGVVTAAVVNLVPVQESMRMLMFSVPDPRLAEAIDTVSDMFRAGTLRSILHVFNDKRIIAMSKSSSTATWTGITAIDGTAAYVSFVEGEIRRALEPKGASITFFDESNLADPALDPMVAGMIRLHAGESNPVFMNGLYHTLGDGSDVADPDDLDATRYGMLACMPFFPVDGQVVTEAVALVEKVCGQHDLVPAIALNPVDANGLESVINVYFDTTVADEVRNAHACMEALHRALYEDGFRFYRVGIEHMDFLTTQEASIWAAGELLKNAFDPDRIIAPGRYNRQ
jgi:4-cresol dehydrogenase (hydroxylating)